MSWWVTNNTAMDLTLSLPETRTVSVFDVVDEVKHEKWILGVTTGDKSSVF